jgi:predicted ATP-grasp superfamily ATP-dependent carboligase
MRVFVYEYTCAALGRGAAAAPLRAEGRAMLAAVAQDFVRTPGVEVATLLHTDFPEEVGVAGCRCVRSRAEARVFPGLAGTADYTVVIAPEFEDLLATRCRWVVEAGGRLLGPSPAAVRLAGDKLALARHLRGCGVPTPSSYPLDVRAGPQAVPIPAVLKPRHGAGSQATILVRNPGEWAESVALARAEAPFAAMITQPFVPGLPASVAFLVGPRGLSPLRPGFQQLSPDGRFRYRGGSLPLPPVLASRAVALAQQALLTVPGLHGYVGVDLVLGAAEDGSADSVIEINPRLTTSYVGLRAVARTNLASALLAVAAGDELSGLRWRSGSVAFTANGTVVQQP